MIVAFVVACVVGLLGGVASDELLRGHDPSSKFVIAAGILGAIGALVVRRTVGGEGLLLEVLTVLIGALLLAFVTRARISSALARGAR